MHLSRFYVCALPFTGMFLCGCLYTTHQFNTGRTVPAGASTFTMGIGTHTLKWKECPDFIIGNKTQENPNGIYDNYYLDDVKCHYGPRFRTFHPDSANEYDTIVTEPNTIKNILPKVSLGYRLGVRDSWGPFKGVDIGIHFEAPTFFASALFDMRLELPPLPLRNLHHAVGIGFIIGAWADNGYFAEYAISNVIGKTEVYAQGRAIYHNTLISKMYDMEDNFKIPHERKWVGQLSAGLKWVLPNAALIPDFIVPQVNATYPMVIAKPDDEFGDNHYRNEVELKLNMGMGWTF